MINIIDTNYINNLLVKADELIKEETQETNQEVTQEEVKEISKEERKAELIRKTQEKLEQIKNIEGLDIEMAGCWLWIGGETYKNKTELKELGFKYASKKQLWYYNPDETFRKYKDKDGKVKTYTIEEIHQRYETTKIK